MSNMPPVLNHVFKAIEKSDIERLSLCRERDIRPILPCLVRMSLIAPLDHSEECIHGRKVILRILSGIEAVNALVALLSIDFTALEADVKKEQSLRQKLGGAHQSESILIQNLMNGLALEFECSDPTRRLRLLLSELLLVMAQMKETRSTYYLKSSELFDNLCYLEEVSDVLCIALAELPSLLPPADVAEALLHLCNGPVIICKIVANQPDSFKEVVAGLLQNAEKQDEDSQGGIIRLKAVRLLCQMNPGQALNVRKTCVDFCVMPALAVYITLDIAKLCSGSSSELASTEDQKTHGIPTNMGRDDSDVLSFLTGLLLSNDQQQRSWFSQFIKSAQRRKFDQPSSALVALRAELVDRLRSLLLFTTSDTLPESQVIKAAALLRLYCALRSLAGLKFNEEKEVGLLLQLVTCRPPPSASGIRFVSTGLCMLIACPSLIATNENEKRASEWIKWLVKEEAYFSGASGVSSSSFGAMLLLMAIHFHLQDLSAIVDLVSAALGMKVATSGNNKMQRIKYIFTHDVFTEQVVTAHAVKVAVTPDLNANMPGFLPIHCIYHQLKSRMFTKHRVPIKQWIYQQICQVQIPLHPFMPQLIEVFVSSILLPSAKGGQTDAFNEPFTEQEIMDVFSLLAFKGDKRSKDGNRFSHSSFKLRSQSTKLISKSKTNMMNSFKRTESFCQNNMETSDLYVASVMPSQLLLLYYLLLYEDVRLNNMQHFLLAGRRVHTYSSHLFAELPIRYLLSHAQRDQKLYAGLFSSLLKLLVTHYPQLCILDDWLYRPPSNQMAILPPQLPLNAFSLENAMQSVVSNPGYLLVLLNKMLELPLQQLWVLADPLVINIKHLLVEGVPRKILDTYRLVWLHLNSLFPRRLWAMTVEGLRSDDSQWRLKLTEDDVVLDPLYVLRCDEKVFRCEPILQILIYLLHVYLLSSKTYLTQHIKNQPAIGFPASLDEEREKLRGALVLTQESAAVQILLESVLDDSTKTKLPGESFVLQETRSIVCSFLHQAFIMDTTLAKLVHFQGYSKELIGLLVQGVPSMHIAVGLGWIPELLQLPDLQKQLFAVELTSHLALQNSMPSTLSIARLVLNTLTTLLSVLGEEERLEIVEKSPAALIRIACAFPELLDDILHLMVSFGRVALAQAALMEAPSPKTIGFYNSDEQPAPSFNQANDKKQSQKCLSALHEKLKQPTSMCSTREDELCLMVKVAFKELVVQATMSSEIY